MTQTDLFINQKRLTDIENKLTLIKRDKGIGEGQIRSLELEDTNYV